MEPWLELAIALFSGVAGIVVQEVRWRRREKAKRHMQEQRVYERLLAVADLTFSAGQEFARLSRGLHWWNGNSRLQILKGTKLDERMPRLLEEFVAAVNGVRLYGSPAAVAAAEDMLAAVAAPLLDPDAKTDQLDVLKDRRVVFLDTVRREQGLPPLADVGREAG